MLSRCLVSRSLDNKDAGVCECLAIDIFVSVYLVVCACVCLYILMSVRVCDACVSWKSRRYLQQAEAVLVVAKHFFIKQVRQVAR